MTDDIDDKPQPLLAHLMELRNRLMWAIGAFFLAFLLCFAFAKPPLTSRRITRAEGYDSFTTAFTSSVDASSTIQTASGSTVCVANDSNASANKSIRA